MTDVVVSGYGVICSQGMNYEECKKNIFNSPKMPSKPKRFETPNIDFPIFDIPREIDLIFSKEAKEYNVFLSTLMALKCLEEAIEMAGLDLEYLKNKNILVSIGTTIAITLNDFNFHKEYILGKAPKNEPFETFLRSNPSNFISNFLNNLNCKPITNATACASGSDAIGIAYLILKRDEKIDLAICGGADEASVVNHQGFISMKIYSKNPCKPFDKKRDGLNLGNGAGILILEREKEAIKRGLKPEIYISGYGSFQDGYHFTHPHPEGKGLEKSILKALSFKNINFNEIDFINAHGTATPENDITEGKVIKRLFPEGIKFLSTKGYTGHTLGAAGAIEAIFAIMALKEEKIMKNIGFDEMDPEIGLIPVIKEERVEKRFALSNSLGFAGANSALLFERKK